MQPQRARRKWPPKRVSRALAAAVTIVVIAAVAVVLLRGGDDGPSGIEAAADRYLAAWSAGDLPAMAAVIETAPTDFAAQYEAITDGLHARRVQAHRTMTDEDGDNATVDFEATFDVGGLGPWTYEGRLTLRKIEKDWLVQWSPAAVHPQLSAGAKLARTRGQPDRAPILGAGDEPLALAVPVVTIGIEPQRMTNLADVERVLAEQLAVPAEKVATELTRPGVQPHYFVPIITVRRERYDAVKAVIYPVPGLVFRESLGRGTIDADFATAVLGRTGEITAELLDQLGASYEVGDQVGLTGLERVFERQLAGTATGDVHIEDAAGTTTAVLMTFAGEAPKPVRTTIDRAAQNAAEAALAGIDGPAALVAVDANGNVVAAASRPLGDDFNRALAGAYPPGSTFKVITAAALLQHGLDPSSPLTCPPTIDVDGRSFRNFEGEAAATLPLTDAFAMSCNTAFIGATETLQDGDLRTAAEQFGFNTDYDLGLDTAGGVFPDPGSATERAAAAIGQGKVTASVVHMASVAAAVASGTWHSPVLLPDRTGDQSTRPLAGEIAPTLGTMMQSVVDRGTGTAAQVQGRPIAGKTGTAEFGPGDPPATHAWFIGFDRGIGVAVLVEGGGVGGEVAAPIAGQFFARL